MRITDRMMTANMLNNINKNKQNMAMYAYQHATGQKIQRPSDDPVVAVRSLKFRTDLRELYQYLEKNVPDASSWMSLTEDALINVNKSLETAFSECGRGVNDPLTVANREEIVNSLTQFKQQIYQEGNSDYGGRYLFTGYRTDIPLQFDRLKTDTRYVITEPLKPSSIEQISYIKGGAEYKAGATPDDYAEMAPEEAYAYRMRLSYDQLKKVDGLTYTDAAGNIKTFTMNTVSVKDENAYDVDGYNNSQTPPTANQVNFIPETGELILSKDAYDALKSATEIKVDYTKDSFSRGELRPEHYFDCDTYELDSSGNQVDSTKKTYTKPVAQSIEYEVNFGQKLKINVMANESITHVFGREIDEILKQVKKVEGLEKKLVDIDKMLADKNNDEATNASLTALREQVAAEKSLEEKIMRDKFGKGATTVKNEQDVVNAALGDLGSRSRRLEMTRARLESQKVDFSEMLASNEKVELEDAVINLTAAELLYNASLSATAKIVQNTLLDFL